MAKRKKAAKKTYKYTCSLTEEEYITTRQAPNPEELTSVNAYYEMNPEEDDRPDIVKIKLGIISKDELN